MWAEYGEDDGKVQKMKKLEEYVSLSLTPSSHLLLGKATEGMAFSKYLLRFSL